MKKILLLALLFAGVMSSCVKNEVTESFASNDIEGLININVSSGVTKGGDTTTSTLGVDNMAVDLYAFGPETEGTKISFTYSYADSEWNNDAGIRWTNIGLPGAFYSLHDGSNPLELTIAADEDHEHDASLTTATATSAFTQDIDSESTDHKDLIFYRSVLQSIPTGNNMNVYHDHALSKIDIYAGTTTDYYAYIARVRFVNVGNGSTVTIEADDSDDSQSVSWSYFEGYSTFNYFADAAATTNSSNSFSGENASLICNETSDNSILIIPQELEGVTKTAIERGDISSNHSYIEVIYCLTKRPNATDEEHYLGWKSVAARNDAGHTTYTSTTTGGDDKYSYVDVDNDSTYNDNNGDYLLTSDSPLYVMSAFSIGHEFEYNTAYAITLGLGMVGSTGGLNLHDGYVDKDGNPIILNTTYDEGNELPELGDLLFPDADSEISVLISVQNGWDSEEGYNIY